MRVRLASRLRRLADWIDPPADAQLVEQLVQWADTLHGATSEHKRAEVLARLQMRRPLARTRDLAFLIERVLQGR